MNTKIKSFILKTGLILGLVLAVFILWGLTNKAEAATSEFKINSKYEVNDQGNPVVSVDSSNRFYIAWEDNGYRVDRFDIFGRIYDSGGKIMINE